MSDVIPRGIIPAMVTPLTQNQELNIPALRRLTNHLIECGVHGLFATGGQGEFWALSAEEKQRVWEVVVEEANGRVPVYAGTGAESTREAATLTRLAEACGVDAVSVLTPYLITPNEDELVAHYVEIAKATRLPVLLYSNPNRTGVKMPTAVVQRLAQIEDIVGVKDSSGLLELTTDYIQNVPPDFSVLMGNDILIFAGLMSGAKGAIAATANVCPRLVVEIYNCFQAGDLDAARRAQEKLSMLRKAITLGSYPVVLKEATDLMGFEAGPARSPVQPLSEEQRDRLRGVLVKMGLEVVK